jgi:hypothetical protein
LDGPNVALGRPKKRWCDNVIKNRNTRENRLRNKKLEEEEKNNAK